MRTTEIFILLILLTQASLGLSQTNDQWTLNQCIDYALENNTTIKSAEYDKNTAEVNYATSKSQVFPNLNFVSSQRLNNGTSIDPITSDFVSQTIHSTSFALNTSVPLFQGFQISNQIKQNKLLIDQNELTIETTKNSIKLNIINAYLQVLYAEEAINIAKVNVETSKQQLLIIQGKYRAEQATLKDISEIQSQLASYDYNLVQANVNLDQQLITLKQLLEIDPSKEIQLSSISDNFSSTWLIPDPIEIYNRSIVFMPEIKSSELQVEVNKVQMDMARGGYLPTLSLSGGLSTGYTSTQPYTFNEQMNSNFSSSVGVSLSIPIFSRNQNRSNVQLADISIEKAKNQTLIAKKELYQNIENAWQNAITAQKQIKSADAARTSAKQAYEFATKQNELGSLSTADLIISQNTYTTAEQTYIQAKYMGVLYKLLIDFYQGNEIKLN